MALIITETAKLRESEIHILFLHANVSYFPSKAVRIKTRILYKFIQFYGRVRNVHTK